MYCSDYHGPRLEVTILKTGFKHNITQTYLKRVEDASDNVKYIAERHSSLIYAYSMSLLSVVTGNGFELANNKWFISESRLVRYVPFIPISSTGDKLWEFTFIFAVTNEVSEQPPELSYLSDEEKESIVQNIVIGSKDCKNLICAMQRLSDVCQELKEIYR